MYRLTARLLLVLLLVGMFVPVALAISAPDLLGCCARKPMRDAATHACCARKTMRRAVTNSGSGNGEIEAVGCQNRNCCTPVTTARWAELGPGDASATNQPLTYLSPDTHSLPFSKHANALQPVRGPPLS